MSVHECASSFYGNVEMEDQIGRIISTRASWLITCPVITDDYGVC